MIKVDGLKEKSEAKQVNIVENVCVRRRLPTGGKAITITCLELKGMGEESNVIV